MPNTVNANLIKVPQPIIVSAIIDVQSLPNQQHVLCPKETQMLLELTS